MTGKIFPESKNIYDDQARILFEYYKKAAEKIVSEEMDFENRMAQQRELIENEGKRKKKLATKKVVFVVLACLFLAGAMALFFTVAGVGSDMFPASVCACASAILFAVLFFVTGSKIRKADARIREAEGRIEVFGEEKGKIRRDYKVSKLSVVYVPVAAKVPFEGKSFVVDHTGSVENTDFSLSILHHPDELQSSLAELEKGTDRIPVVDGNENAETVDTSGYSISMQNVVMHDFLGNVDRQIRNMNYLLHDSDEKNVSLPVVIPGCDYDVFLKNHATSDVDGKKVVNVFDTSAFEAKVQSFNDLNRIKKNKEQSSSMGDGIDYFKGLMKKLGDTVQTVSRVKTNSMSKLLNYTNKIMSAVFKAGYNHYSPTLEADEIERIKNADFNYEDSVETYHPFYLAEGSRVKYDIFSEVWVAEDQSRTNLPFGMNQVAEEVLMPVINNLMNETRIERLKIYNNVKDQKMSYLNKWHQDVESAFRDNRSSGLDLVTEITNAYAEFTSHYQTYVSFKNTQDAMKNTQSLDSATVQESENEYEVIMGFEAQARECNKIGEDFQNYIDRLQEDIQKKSEKFGHIEYFEASLRDSESRKMARSLDSDNLQSLDVRRQQLIPVSSYYASYAEIPPLPSVEDRLDDDFMINLQEQVKISLEKLRNGNDSANDTLDATGLQPDGE